MKRISKFAVAIVMAVAMVFSLTACGEIDVNKVKGDWTTETIGGNAVEAANAVNVNISDDGKKVTFKSALGTESLESELRSDGVQTKKDGKDYVGLAFKDDKITYTLSIDGTNYEYVLKKGTTDFGTQAAADDTAAADDAAAADDTAAADDAAADDTAAADDAAADDAVAADDAAADDAAAE